MTIFLFTHIIIALTTLIAAGSAALRPTAQLINSSWVGVTLTFISGTILVVVNSSALVTACISGLSFLALSSALLLVARKRLIVAQ